MSEKNPLERTLHQKSERELTPEELKEKILDPSRLPTHEEIAQAFESKGSYLEKYLDWNKFRVRIVQELSTAELLNEEFLEALGDYLSQRAKEFGATENEPLIILEVGAGNGRLTHFLQQKLEERMPGKIKVIATDSGEKGIKTTFPVQPLEQKAALKAYKPKIVICSWMPIDKDWTADFRATDNVEEYILIGEPNTGSSGDKWRTWGAFDKNEEPEKINQLPPYEADGFERSDIKHVSEHQITLADEPGDYDHSRTTSFKRKK